MKSRKHRSKILLLLFLARRIISFFLEEEEGDYALKVNFFEKNSMTLSKASRLRIIVNP